MPESTTTKTILPLTLEIRFAQERLTALRDALPAVLAPQWWWHRRISVSERVTFIREFADARATLFSSCERAYPQLTGQPYAVSDLGIEFEPSSNASPVEGREP